jgi:hypothetical protein
MRQLRRREKFRGFGETVSNLTAPTINTRSVDLVFLRDSVDTKRLRDHPR